MHVFVFYFLLIAFSILVYLLFSYSAIRLQECSIKSVSQSMECVACWASGLNGPQHVQTPVENISVWTRLHSTSVSRRWSHEVCKRWTGWIWIWIHLPPHIKLTYLRWTSCWCISISSARHVIVDHATQLMTIMWHCLEHTCSVVSVSIWVFYMYSASFLIWFV